jgi:YD repeat-containing protein
VTSARGFVTTTTFDVLNRPVKRLSPQVTYSQQLCMEWDFNTGGYCTVVLPTRGTSVCISADTATFSYDAGGNMIRADNIYGHIRRKYTPGGALVGDTLVTGTWYNSLLDSCGDNGGDADPSASGDRNFTHVYELRIAYDVGGRRDSLMYPAAVGGGVQRHWYNATSGMLDSTTDAQGNKIKFVYDTLDRLKSTTFPGGVSENFTYDLDSRLASRSSTYDNADYQRDAMGRMVSTASTNKGTLYTWYNGTGGVIGASNATDADGGNQLAVYDAIGNKTK